MGKRSIVPPSRWADIQGPVHYVRWDGPPDGPTFVLVHGLGGSLLNWLSVAPGLARRGPVLALDLAGFGRTPLDVRSSTPHANRMLVHRFVEQVAGPPAVLVGNSMGGAIALHEAAAGGRAVGGLVLTNPALPRVARSWPDPLVVAMFAANTVPGLGSLVARERARRLGPEGLVRSTMALCSVDPSRVDPEVIREHVALAEHRASLGYAVPAFLRAARALVRSNLAGKRVWKMAEMVSVPTLLIHGKADRLVPLAAARELARRRPDWKAVFMDGVGHIPQLEAPERWLDAVNAWLDDPAVAADLARSRRARIA